MMHDWRAVTVSGTVYECIEGIVEITQRGHSYMLKPLRFKSSKSVALMPNDTEDWPDVDLPVVGERMFLAEIGQWRISTEVESVEDLH